MTTRGGGSGGVADDPVWIDRFSESADEFDHEHEADQALDADGAAWVPTLPPAEPVLVPAVAVPVYEQAPEGAESGYADVAPAVAYDDPAPRSQIWTPDAVREVHRATNMRRRDVQRTRSRQLGAQFLVAMLVVGGLFAGLIVGVVWWNENRSSGDAEVASLSPAAEPDDAAPRGGEAGPGALLPPEMPQVPVVVPPIDTPIEVSASLPFFPAARPDYGTVTVEFSSIGPTGGSESGTITANDDATSYRIVGAINEARFEIVRTDAGLFGLRNDAWIELGVDSAVSQLVATAAVVTTFDDLVPLAARNYVDVIDIADTQLRDIVLQRVDLSLDAAAFAAGDPDGFAAWVALQGGDPEQVVVDDRPVYLEIWVDDAGVVWRWRSQEREPGRSTAETYEQYDLISFEADRFVAAVPATSGTVSG